MAQSHWLPNNMPIHIHCRRKKNRFKSELHIFRRIFRILYSFRLNFRAIPEAGYITLGTIRYGLKLANGSGIVSMVNENNNTPSGEITIPKRRQCSSPHFTLNETNAISDDQRELASLSDVSNASSITCNKCTGYCCIDTTKLSLPWTSSNKVNGNGMAKMANAEAG